MSATDTFTQRGALVVALRAGLGVSSAGVPCKKLFLMECYLSLPLCQLSTLSKFLGMLDVLFSLCFWAASSALKAQMLLSVYMP